MGWVTLGFIVVVTYAVGYIFGHRDGDESGFARGEKVGYLRRKGIEFGRAYGMPNPQQDPNDPTHFRPMWMASGDAVIAQLRNAEEQMTGRFACKSNIQEIDKPITVAFEQVDERTARCVNGCEAAVCLESGRCDHTGKRWRV